MTLEYEMKDTSLHHKGFMPKRGIHNEYLTLRHDQISIIYGRPLESKEPYQFKRLVMPHGKIDRDLLGRISIAIIQDDFRREEGVSGLMKVLSEFRERR